MSLGFSKYLFTFLNIYITLTCGIRKYTGKKIKILSSICYRDFFCENSYPVNIYLLRVNNRNIRARCEMCSKVTIKTSEQRQWHHSGAFIVNFEHISHLFLVFLLSSLNMLTIFTKSLHHIYFTGS